MTFKDLTNSVTQFSNQEFLKVHSFLEEKIHSIKSLLDLEAVLVAVLEEVLEEVSVLTVSFETIE
jgi:hypothetical protein